MQFRCLLALVLSLALSSCGGGGGGGSAATVVPPAPTIQGMVFNFPAGAAPAGLPTAMISVNDSVTGAPIPNATVSVNGVNLNYISAPTHLDYEGAVLIPPGAAVAMTVTVNGRTYTANGVQATTYPTLLTPTAGSTLGTASPIPVTWTAGAASPNSQYLLGVLDSNDPAGATPYFQAVPLGMNTYTIPANSLTAGVKDLIIGITNAAPVSNASANSILLYGGFSYAPVITNAGLSPPPKTLTSIAITPVAPTMVIGSSMQLTAMGTYSDTTTQDLTSLVTWAPANPAVVSVSPTGLATAAGNGAAPVTATFNGISATITPTVVPSLTLAVSSASPANAAVGASVYSKITAQFNQSVTPASIQPGAISPGGFTLTQNGIAVPGTMTLSNANNSMTFTPSASLLPNMLYTATLSATIQTAAGITLLNNYVWSFTTENANFKDAVTIRTPAMPLAIATGDVNGDGRNDVVITTSMSRSLLLTPPDAYKVLVYLQDALGNLAPPVIYSANGSSVCELTAVDIGDLNGDGRNDVVVGSSACGINILYQAANGTLNPPVQYPSTAAKRVRVADLNKDGKLDVVNAGDWGANTVEVRLQNAAGGLNGPTAYNVLLSANSDLTIADINNDTLPDILLMSAAPQDPDLEVLIQTPAGTFLPHADYNIGAIPSVSSLAVGDINGDTLNDAIVTYSNNINLSKLGIFNQNLTGVLNAEVPVNSMDMPVSVVVADVTNDGRKDIVVLHHGFSKLGVYEQLPNGTLMPEYLYQRPSNPDFNPHCLAIGDINGDGKVDAISTDTINGLVINYHY